MELFEDYAFVVSGKKRKEVVKLLQKPKTPTELAKTLKVHANVITRILQDLAIRDLVTFYQISGKRKTFILTERAESARKILNSLSQPKTLPELTINTKIRKDITRSIIKLLKHNNLITTIKTTNQNRKYYRLTEKGEEIRGKLG